MDDFVAKLKQFLKDIRIELDAPENVITRILIEDTNGEDLARAHNQALDMVSKKIDELSPTK